MILAEPLPANIARHVNAVPFNAALGIRYARSGPGWLEATLSCDGDLVRPATPAIAMGVITCLIDATCGATVLMSCGPVRPSVTLNLQVDLVRPGLAGATLHARAKCIDMDDQVAFVQARIKDGEGAVVATGLAKFLFVRDE